MLAFALCAMFVIGLLTGVIATVAACVHFEHKQDLRDHAEAMQSRTNRVGPNPFTPTILKD